MGVCVTARWAQVSANGGREGVTTSFLTGAEKRLGVCSGWVFTEMTFT